MKLPTNTANTGMLLTAIYNPDTISFRDPQSTLSEPNIGSQPFLKQLDLDTQEIIYKIQSTSEAPLDYDLDSVVCIGHRGHGMDSYNKDSTAKYNDPGKTSTPLRENTIDSFLLAHQEGAQMVEMDIHKTSDDELVVYHDAVINGRMIADMDYSEFLVATNSTVECYRSTNTNLRTILESLPAGLGVYLEIKYDHQLKYRDDYDTAVVLQIIELLKSHCDRPVLFASFSPLICLLLKSYAPAYKTCLLIGKDSIRWRPTVEDFCLSVVDFVEKWKIDGVIADTDIAGDVQPIIDMLRGRRSLLCYGDSTNDASEVRRLRALGYTGFCTDVVGIYPVE